MNTSASPTPPRYLIVNADDFGQSAGINDGIIRCHELGILTSASLMVRWPDAPAAAAYTRGRRGFSVGLHIDLGEWAYRGGEWVPLHSVVSTDDVDAVGAEVMRQLELFRSLMGIDPTHLDSHQHVHRYSPAAGMVRKLGAALGVTVRHYSSVVTYEGGFYGQGARGESCLDALTAERLMDMVRMMPQGVTELGCHPGLQDDAPGMYVAERTLEVSALCDPRVRAVLDLERIRLISFDGLNGKPSSQPLRQ